MVPFPDPLKSPASVESKTETLSQKYHPSAVEVFEKVKVGREKEGLAKFAFVADIKLFTVAEGR